MRTPCRTETNLAVSKTPNADVKISIGGEQAELSQDVNYSANSDVPEEVFCGLRATLSGFVNLGGG
jgi:hypothetical protein